MKANSFLALCSLATALWGCSSEQESNTSENMILRINSCYAMGEEQGEINDFGMFLTTQDGAIFDANGNNAHVTQDHGLWETPSITISPDQSAQLFAYCPYTEDATVTDIPVCISSQTDYLYSKGQTVTYSSYTPSIELYHLLSKITIQINDEAVESLSVSGYPEDGTLNLYEGTLSKGKTNTTVMSEDNGILLFPGYNDIVIDITYQGNSYHYPLTIDLESGKEYIYSLVLQQNNKLEISKVTIINWETGGNYEGTIETGI
jgi:hypothetical protein